MFVAFETINLLAYLVKHPPELCDRTLIGRTWAILMHALKSGLD